MKDTPKPTERGLNKGEKMEDQIYATDDDYNLKQIKSLERYCDREFGTEFERNEEDNTYYLMVFDLNYNEVSKLRGFEKWFRKCEELR